MLVASQRHQVYSEICFLTPLYIACFRVPDLTLCFIRLHAGEYIYLAAYVALVLLCCLMALRWQRCLGMWWFSGQATDAV